MVKEPASTANDEAETTVDRFEHEIQQLEEPLGHSARQWLVAVAVAAALVCAFFLGSMIQSKKSVDPSSLAIASIDTLEPQPAVLSEKPTRFRWESLSGATRYMLTIREAGGDQDLIVKEAQGSFVELGPDEVAKLAKGGRYQWMVRALSRQGTIDEGRSSFSLQTY